MKNIPCEIIEDLLPSFKDEVLSDSVREAVQNHIDNCPNCRHKFEEIEQHIAKEELEQTEKDKKFMIRIKRAKYYLIGVLIGAAIPIGALITFIIYVFSLQ